MPTKAASDIQQNNNNVQDLFDLGPSQPVASSTPNAAGAGDWGTDDWGDFGSVAPA